MKKSPAKRTTLLIAGIVIIIFTLACCFVILYIILQVAPMGMAEPSPLFEPDSNEEVYAPPPSTSTLSHTDTVLQTSTLPATQPASTPDATQTLLAAFHQVDLQFQNTISSYIAYNAPQSMKLDETEVIELLLQPGSTAGDLSTQVVEQGGFVTSEAEPGVLFSEQGGEMAIVTAEIEITDVMKAVLISPDPDAFQIQELHGSAEQPLSTLESTSWRWAVTAREEGTHTLELIIYRLLRVGEETYWRDVQTYDAKIEVKVSPFHFLKKWDWKWTLGVIVSLLQIPLVWSLLEKRKKARQAQAGERADKN